MSYIKKTALTFTILLALGTSIVGVNMAIDLKESCDVKVKAGQTCTNCIRVEDMIKELGL